MKVSTRTLRRLLLAILLTPAILSADVVDRIIERGSLRCGVNGEIPGLSYRDATGEWSGMDVDLCRAVAAATLGSPDRVELIPLTTAERFNALREERIDVLARNTTWTQARDLGKGVSFTAIYYYDGQGFMVPRSTNTLSTLELDKARICAIAETTSGENAANYFKRHRMAMELKQYPDLDTALKAYLGGECSTLTTDRSQLYSIRASLDNPGAQRILPEVISREPLSPAVRKGETRFFDLVQWTVYTLINAEQLGITSDNVATAKARAQNRAVGTLLDLDGETAGTIGIEPGWGYRVLLAIGNYAEVFERNLGKASGLDIKRGMNALWNRGGLLYAPPPR